MYYKVTKLKKFTLLILALTGLFAANQAIAVQGGNCSLNGDGEITDDTSSNPFNFSLPFLAHPLNLQDTLYASV